MAKNEESLRSSGIGFGCNPADPRVNSVQSAVSSYFRSAKRIAM